MQDEKNIHYDTDNINIYDVWLAIKKRKWAIGIIIIISFGLSFAYSLYLPNVYKVSNTLILSQYAKDFINMSEIKSAILPLKSLSKKQRAKALNLEKSVLEAIGNINIAEIKGTKSLKIEVDTVNTDAGVSMINALLVYANQIPFVHKRLNLEIELLNKNRVELKQFIDDPISLLNLHDNAVESSILDSMYKLRESYNSMTISIRELEKGQVVSLAGNFFVPDKPFKPKRRLLKVMGLIAGIVLGIFLAFLMEWMASARREHESRK